MQPNPLPAFSAGRRNPFGLLAAPLLCALVGAAAAAAGLGGLFAAGRSVPLRLPAVEGAGSGAAAATGHVITVLAGGDYRLGGQRISRAELARRLKLLGRLSGAEREAVLIRAEAAAPFERVVDLLELCRRSGLTSVRFEVAAEGAR